MRWKTVLGVLAAIGSAVAVIVYRHRRVDLRTLGTVSQDWIAEHIPDEPE